VAQAARSYELGREAPRSSGTRRCSGRTKGQVGRQAASDKAGGVDDGATPPGVPPVSHDLRPASVPQLSAVVGLTAAGRQKHKAATRAAVGRIAGRPVMAVRIVSIGASPPPLAHGAVTQVRERAAGQGSGASTCRRPASEPSAVLPARHRARLASVPALPVSGSVLGVLHAGETRPGRCRRHAGTCRLQLTAPVAANLRTARGAATSARRGPSSLVGSRRSGEARGYGPAPSRPACPRLRKPGAISSRPGPEPP
jgi:hypothetical protein